jgi:opacity protein-like surface antigen
MNMKKLIVLFAALAMTLSSFAQYDDESGRSDDIQTIMGKNNAIGGYGAILIQYTELDDRDAFVFGARGALIMGHMMSLGLAGSGFFNDVHYDPVLEQDISLAGGYGGFFFEPVIMPKYPVHVSFPILIGAGGLAVVSVDNEDNWNDNYKSEASDAFMVIEPGVEIELNVTRFFRFCVGAYYRYTSDVDIEDPQFNVPTDILQGFSGGVTFKFGRF